MPTAATPQPRPTHIVEMMERLGLDPGAGAIARLSLAHMTVVHRCQACPLKPKCGAWLECHREPLTFAPAFCPSCDILFEMKASDPGALR